jgi:hypothetical protein
MDSNHRADSALGRARQAAVSLKPAAQSASAMTSRGVRRTRAWAAPQIERTGHLVRDRLAPKISSLLSSAARRVEPGKPRGRRWRKVAGASAATAAASALAGAVFNRRRHNGTSPDAEADSHDDATAPSMETATAAPEESQTTSS